LSKNPKKSFKNSLTTNALKIVAYEKQRRSGMWQIIDIGGDGCTFLFLFGRHLGKIIFPFPISPAQ
jgi:hypothetical protein